MSELYYHRKKNSIPCTKDLQYAKMLLKLRTQILYQLSKRKSLFLYIIIMKFYCIKIILIFYIFVNLLTFFLFFAYKRKAVKGKWRISEKTLLLLCFFGGALGGFLGKHIKYHKTNKKKLTVGVTMMLIIQLCIYSVAIGFLGFWLYFR